MNDLVNSPLGGLGGKKIFLTGFMGSGKTYWGKLWAAQTGMNFLDLDEVIEAAEGATIAALFEQYGEAWFRQKETDTLKTFAQKHNCIIACGGGTACFNNNMQWMNENGITVYLLATAAEIVQRVVNEQDKRPLIKDFAPKDLLAFVDNKIKERMPFYNQAKIILPVATVSLNSISNILNYA
jgi:shikimate kinase